MSKNRYCGILLYSVISFLISALSFILIPFSNFEGTKLQKAIAYMVGFIFWIGLIVGLILTHYLGKIRQKHNYRKYVLPGILCFFKNNKSNCRNDHKNIDIFAFLIFKETKDSWKDVFSIIMLLTDLT